jgi:hypothetical protein
MGAWPIQPWVLWWKIIEAMARHIKLYISPWEREPHLCGFAITFSAWSSDHGAGITI